MSEIEHRVEKDGDKIKIFLEGKLNMKVSSKVRKVLHHHLGENPSEMVVDLAKVPFIDSSGVAILIEALRLQMKAKRSLRLENPTEQVRYTLKITQLSKVFGIEDLQEETS